MTTHTTESVLAGLGYSDPLEAARQHARMILLGRLAHYQTLIAQFESRWGCSLEEMRRKYQLAGEENFASDDAYLDWQCYVDLANSIQQQLDVLHKH